MSSFPNRVQAIPWQNPQSEQGKRELGLYILAMARMLDMQVELAVSVPIATVRGAKLTSDLFSDIWIPDGLRTVAVYHWNPLDRYLTFVAQAYAEILACAALLPRDKIFWVNMEEDPGHQDELLYSFRRR